VLLEARQVKAALSAMTVRTDRKDARGIAQLLRMGWYRPVHGKAGPAQEIRALLAGRRLLLGKLRDVELSVRGLLRGFGLKVGTITKGRLEARIRELIAGHAMLERVIAPMLHEVAHTMLTRSGRFSALQRWAVEVAQVARPQARQGGAGEEALGRAAADLDGRRRVPASKDDVRRTLMRLAVTGQLVEKDGKHVLATPETE
jgi:hypothetical protein